MGFIKKLRMKTAIVTVDYVDENGNPKQMVETTQYDPQVNSDLMTIEFISIPKGGPLMRPKNPRS